MPNDQKHTTIEQTDSSKATTNNIPHKYSNKPNKTTRISPLINDYSHGNKTHFLHFKHTYTTCHAKVNLAWSYYLIPYLVNLVVCARAHDRLLRKNSEMDQGFSLFHLPKLPHVFLHRPIHLQQFARTLNGRMRIFLQGVPKTGPFCLPLRTLNP